MSPKFHILIYKV